MGSVISTQERIVQDLPDEIQTPGECFRLGYIRNRWAGVMILL